MKIGDCSIIPPIIGKEVDFKDFVMHNHTKVDNIIAYPTIEYEEAVFYQPIEVVGI